LEHGSAQEELAFQAQVLRHVNDSVVVTDLDGRITYWNDGATRLFGYAREEVLGKLPALLYPDQEPSALTDDLDAIKRDQSFSGEWRGRRKDGSEIWIDIKTTLMRDLDGTPIGFIGVGKDVTARKASELRKLLLEREREAAADRTRRLQQLTEALTGALTPEDVAQAVASAGLVALGARVSCVWLVGKRGAALELAAIEGDAGPNVERFRSPALTEALPICEAVRERRPVFVSSTAELVARFPTTRGAALQKSWAAIPIAAGDRALGALLLAFASERTFEDTEQGLMLAMARQGAIAIERALLYAKERQDNRAKDEFLAMLGHELRNPLSPILTALQLMRLRGGEALLKERTIIERQVRQLMRLVDDLLDVSRITRGKIELQVEPVEIAEVVAKAIEMAAPMIEQRKHRLISDVPSHGLLVRGDELRLSQVVSNLLNNAAKYTAPGGTIAVSAGRESDRAVLRIRDNGMGIATELLPRLFDLFVQGERALDREGGGLGLGLTIVRRLVELHGGEVAAFSAGENQGSEFTVRLPLAERADARPPRRRPRSAPRPRSARASALRVLVVDDNRDAAEVLVETLGALGYATRIAFDGHEALAVAQAFSPQLAFVDIGLPGLDGYELAGRLRKAATGSAPVLVAVTGYGQEADQRRSREAGFAAHLIKPVDLARLVEIAERVAGEHAAPPA
jgi:PAS domain S-box-containing protein